MHYYQFNIKTYLASTVHLTDGEDLAYRRLIDHYYDTELPIPTALPVLCRRLRLALPDVETILKEFFVETHDGWKHDYIDKEIAAYKAFLAKQKANGSKGGRRSKPDANPPLNPKEPSAKPTTNNKQLTINNKQEDKSANAPTAYADLLLGVPIQIVEDWKALRKAKKAPITRTVVEGAISESVKAGMSLTDFLAEWCSRGSQGLKAEWLTSPKSANYEPPYAKYMREKMEQISPSIAAKNPNNPIKKIDPNEFLRTIEAQNVVRIG